MAVPSSGILYLGGLAFEKLENEYDDGLPSTIDDSYGPFSLRDITQGGDTYGGGEDYDATNTASTSYPNNTAPFSMSEFYSYDHDAVASSTLTSFGSSERQTKAACGYGTNLQETYYHNGTGLIQTGDNVYSDSSGNNPLQAGQYKVGPFVGTYYNIVVAGNAGEISSRQTCP